MNSTTAQVTNDDLFSTKPGTLAGRYLRTFWQPVFRSEDLARERAYPIRIMGEDLVVYRGSSGRAHLAQGYCPHRATQISTGWVEGEAIRCRYHGWKFDEDGSCSERPGEDPAFSSRVRLQTYPVQEYLGLVFAYLGEGEPPPMRRFTDFERSGVLECGPPEFWPCNYYNRIDNAADIMHLMYTHRLSVERAGHHWRLETPASSAEETEYGVRSSEVRPGRPTAYAHFHMPNINQIRSRARIEGTMADAAKLWGDRLFWRVPVDDNNCVSYVLDYFPLFGAEAAAYSGRRRDTQQHGLDAINKTGASILRGESRIEDLGTDLSIYKTFWIEDYCVQVGQKPISNSRSEHHGRIDGGVLLVRKLWRRELEALANGRPLTRWLTPAGLAEMSEELV